MAIVNSDLLRLITAERDKLNNMIERIQAGYDLRPVETIETPASEPKNTTHKDLTPTGRKRRKVSAAGRARMSEAQRRRWGTLKTTSKTTSTSGFKTGPGFRNGVHWTQTPEGRRRMTLISRRYAKAKA